MITNLALTSYCNDYLKIIDFKDYCPNGLQIEGKQEINNIVCGVSCNLALIKQAVKLKADAIFVHHGLFWRDEKAEITGAKYKKIKLLIENNINLFAYHLPLDAHPVVGNNIVLADMLKIKNVIKIDNSLVHIGELALTVSDFSRIIEQKLARKPMIFGNNTIINKIAFCTGAAQNYIDIAIENQADCYLSGEISEHIPAIAIENNINYIAAGHYATERYGVQALCTHLMNKFNLKQQFIEIENIV